MPATLKNSSVAIGPEKINFHSNLKETQCQRMFKLPHNCTHFTSHTHASKVRLKILQARLQQNVNQELLDVQTVFRKGRRTRNQIANIHWIKKQESSRKTSTSALSDYDKAFDCVDHNKLWKILQEMGISDYLTCHLRNMYAGQEATVRTEHGTMNWFQMEESVKAVYCHPAYLTYIQTTLCEMPGWMKHKLESGLLEEISITSDIQMTPPLWQKVKRN